MPIPLLLEASTTSQAVPYAVYATLAVGVLSLIASGLNIFFSSKTAQKVVNLSTKTTREVAELSAQVSRESAGLAAETAKELKKQEYKNDFNKKVLEKRLNAWIEAEQILFPLRALVRNRVGEHQDRFDFFYNEDEFNSLLNSLNKNLVSQVFWLGGNYSVLLIKFRNILINIRTASLIADNKSNDEVYPLNSEKLLVEGAKAHEELIRLFGDIFDELAILIGNLHEIDDFIKNKKLT